MNESNSSFGKLKIHILGFFREALINIKYWGFGAIVFGFFVGIAFSIAYTVTDSTIASVVLLVGSTALLSWIFAKWRELKEKQQE